MAETAIEWTQRTWNPIVGCTIVSPGCTNCYAMAIAERFKDVYQGRPFVGAPAEAMTRKVNGKAVWTGQLTLAPERTLLEPLRRQKPTTWFVNSMGDLFHEAVPDEWIDRVNAVMALTPQHTYQVLTKRSARMRAYAADPATAGRIYDIVCDLSLEQAANVILLARPEHAAHAPPGRHVLLGRWPLPNVWVGVSAEDQKRADERIPDLLATPAAIRFVSAEPLLGPINFTGIATHVSGGKHVNTGMLNALSGAAAWHPTGVDDRGRAFIQSREFAKLDWIIVGGESGREARPMHPDWARHIRDQCAAAGTAFFFKQWGEFRLVPADDGSEEWPARWFADAPPRKGQIARMERVGKKRAGRLLDRVQHDGMPEVRHG